MPAYRCPVCGKADTISVAALAWVRLRHDAYNDEIETVPDESDDGHEFDARSQARCRNCGTAGELHMFDARRAVLPHGCDNAAFGLRAAGALVKLGAEEMTRRVVAGDEVDDAAGVLAVRLVPGPVIVVECATTDRARAARFTMTSPAVAYQKAQRPVEVDDEAEGEDPARRARPGRPAGAT
jgi:hypothetical protein